MYLDEFSLIISVAERYFLRIQSAKKINFEKIKMLMQFCNEFFFKFLSLLHKIESNKELLKNSISLISLYIHEKVKKKRYN